MWCWRHLRIPRTSHVEWIGEAADTPPDDIILALKLRYVGQIVATSGGVAGEGDDACHGGGHQDACRTQEQVAGRDQDFTAATAKNRKTKLLSKELIISSAFVSIGSTYSRFAIEIDTEIREYRKFLGNIESSSCMSN